MKIKISKTPKTFTLRFPVQYAGKRFIIQQGVEGDDTLYILPTDNPHEGYTVNPNTRCITFGVGKNFRFAWPNHYKVEVELSESNGWFFIHPGDDQILSAVVRTSYSGSKNAPDKPVKKASAARAELLPQSAMILLEVNQKTYSFEVPYDVLMDTVMAWSTAGYSTPAQ